MAQGAALTWLAYQLTKASIWPSLVGAMQVLPTFVLGVWGGSLADRSPKRPLIFLSQASLLFLAVLLGGLVLLGHVTPWHLLAVAAAAGIVNAIDLPARLAFVIDLVGREDLTNAIALNSLLFNTARMVGPAVTAVLFALAGAGETRSPPPACASSSMDLALWPCWRRWPGWTCRRRSRGRTSGVRPARCGPAFATWPSIPT